MGGNCGGGGLALLVMARMLKEAEESRKGCRRLVYRGSALKLF